MRSNLNVTKTAAVVIDSGPLRFGSQVVARRIDVFGPFRAVMAGRIGTWVARDCHIRANFTTCSKKPGPIHVRLLRERVRECGPILAAVGPQRRQVDPSRGRQKESDSDRCQPDQSAPPQRYAKHHTCRHSREKRRHECPSIPYSAVPSRRSFRSPPASYSVPVRQVAALLPRFLQTAPRGHRPCASLALCLHQTWAEDLHLRAVKHARHTRRRGKRSTTA